MITLLSFSLSLFLSLSIFCIIEVITVVTCDGHNLVGNLRGFDQTTNVILDECHERVFSPGAGVEQVVLGLYIIRGDNM